MDVTGMLEAPTKQRASSVDVFGEDVGHDGQLNCSDGQDTTMKGLMVETNGTSDERTPSSSPNSTSNLQHTSSKPGPSSAAAPAPGRGTSLQSQHSYLKEHLKQQQEAQEQGLEEDSTSQYRHGLTATGAVRSEQLQLQETRAESGPASQSAQGSMQAMQQMPDTRTTSSSQQQQAAEGEDDEAATGTDGGDEAAQAQLGLELLGAVAAATEAAPQWPPVSAAFAAAAGAAAAEAHGQHSMPIACSRGVRAAAAGVAVAAAAAAEGGPEADDDGSLEVSYGSQRSRGGRASGSASAGSTGLALVCQVPDCGVPLGGQHVSPYFRRHRVCVAHAKADAVNMHGKNYRFCQQCGVLHPLEDFDGARKSCRVQLDKHNLRRRCRRKSQTKTPAPGGSFFPDGRPMGLNQMDPYGGSAQLYGLTPAAAWGAMQCMPLPHGALAQAAMPKTGSGVWGRGVSEDTGEVSRDRDEAGTWPSDAAESGPHRGFPNAWGLGPGGAYDPAMYAAMGAGAAHVQQYQQHQQRNAQMAAATAAAAMQGGSRQDNWGMIAGAQDSAAAAAAPRWREGWNPAAMTASGAAQPDYGTASASAAPAPGGAADSYAASLAAATAAANGFKGSGPPSAPTQPKGSGAKSASAAATAAAAAAAAAAAGLPDHFVAALAEQLEVAAAERQQHSRQDQQQQSSGPPSHGHQAKLDPAAAAAMFTPEAHSIHTEVAAVGHDPGAAAAPANGRSRSQARGSNGGSNGGGGSSNEWGRCIGLQQLRLHIAAAIAAGKGPGLIRVRDLGFVQQLLIVDELAHGVLAEMQKDSENQQHDLETGLGSVSHPGAGTSAAAAAAEHQAPAQPLRQPLHCSTSHAQEQPPHQQKQQQPQQRMQHSPYGTHQQQQQPQPAVSPVKAESHREPFYSAAAAGNTAPAQPAVPGTNVPPAALAALMEQIAKYATNPSMSAAAAAASSQQQQGGRPADRSSEQQQQQEQQQGSRHPPSAAMAAADFEHVRQSSTGQPASYINSSSGVAGAGAGAGNSAGAARQPGGSSTSSKHLSGVKREPSTLNMVPVQKRTKPDTLGQPASNGQQQQGLRRPGGAASAAGGSSNGSFWPSSRPLGNSSQQQQGPDQPPQQQQQHSVNAQQQQQQLQQQLQGFLSSQHGAGQAAQVLSQLLQQLAAGGGGGAGKSPASQ